MNDAFLTIRKPAEAFYKVKASKFYAFAFPVTSMEEVEEALSSVKQEHHKARHFCYGYFLGIERHEFRANDDGEPSGTAGKPILGQLEKRNLTDSLVIVVRYFGGTKLGTSGLIQAYREAAHLALEEAEIYEQIVKAPFVVSSNYEKAGPLLGIISKLGIAIKETNYDKDAEITLEVRKSEVTEKIKHLKAQLLDRPFEDIDDDTKVDGIRFQLTE